MGDGARRQKRGRGVEMDLADEAMVAREGGAVVYGPVAAREVAHVSARRVLDVGTVPLQHLLS